MDIAPNYARSSSALINAAGAVAGIFSPPVALGWILERTGSWTTPFAFSVGLLLFAIVMTWWIKPERSIADSRELDGPAIAGKQSSTNYGCRPHRD